MTIMKTRKLETNGQEMVYNNKKKRVENNTDRAHAHDQMKYISA